MRWWRKWAITLVLTGAGCAMTPAPTEISSTAPPVPPGQARIWLYRPWEPSESLNFANIDVNGSYFGSVANGSVFYRDVPPGHYHIAPQSYGRDFNQDKDVDLAPAQQLCCKVASLRSWEEGGDVGVFNRDTFYVWLMAPQAAQVEIAHDRTGI